MKNIKGLCSCVNITVRDITKAIGNSAKSKSLKKGQGSIKNRTACGK